MKSPRKASAEKRLFCQKVQEKTSKIKKVAKTKVARNVNDNANGMKPRREYRRKRGQECGGEETDIKSASPDFRRSHESEVVTLPQEKGLIEVPLVPKTDEEVTSKDSQVANLGNDLGLDVPTVDLKTRRQLIFGGLFKNHLTAMFSALYKKSALILCKY